MYSDCSRYHPNRFTFGRVIAERANTAKTRRKVNPIFVWRLTSSRIISQLIQLLLHSLKLTSSGIRDQKLAYVLFFLNFIAHMTCNTFLRWFSNKYVCFRNTQTECILPASRAAPWRITETDRETYRRTLDRYIMPSATHGQSNKYFGRLTSDLHWICHEKLIYFDQV